MTLNTLEDFIPYSEYVEPSIRIMRKFMATDSGHDEGHLVRVCRLALHISDKEGGDLNVILPACILHDVVNPPKDNLENRKKASLLSADLASVYLEDTIPNQYFRQRIHHAIHAHSYSANVVCQDVNAMIVQDADRLEALGMIGIARLFSVGGSLGRALFNANDPLCEKGDPEEYKYTLDHYFTKLIKLPNIMQTKTGADLAWKRLDKMDKFIKELDNEIKGEDILSPNMTISQ
jgi:uncharacterized protein